jgi:hypothetical protein
MKTSCSRLGTSCTPRRQRARPVRLGRFRLESEGRPRHPRIPQRRRSRGGRDRISRFYPSWRAAPSGHQGLARERLISHAGSSCKALCRFRLLQQIRQSNDLRRQPSSLILRHALHGPSPTRLILEIHEGQRLLAGIHDAEAFGFLDDAPGTGEELAGSLHARMVCEVNRTPKGAALAFRVVAGPKSGLTQARRVATLGHDTFRAMCERPYCPGAIGRSKRPG